MIDSVSFNCDLHSMPNCTRLALLFTILSRVFFYYFNRTFSIRLFDTVVALQNTWIDVLASSFDYNTIWFHCSSTSSSSSYFLFAWDWYCCRYRAYSRGTMVYPKRAQQAHAEYIWRVFICKRVNLHQNWLLCFTNSHRKCEQRRKKTACNFIYTKLNYYHGTQT